MLFGGPPDARADHGGRLAAGGDRARADRRGVLRRAEPDDGGLRRAWERELVEQYHDALLAEGVKGYSLEECWRDYRLCAIGPSRITLSFSARPRDDMGGGHLLELQQTLIQRVSAAMEDLDMEEFV